MKHAREEGALTHEVQARIVRLEINENDPVGVWRYRMAVRFAEPLPRAFVLDGARGDLAPPHEPYDDGEEG